MSQPTHVSRNLLVNGGFENGTLGPWEILNPGGLPLGVTIIAEPDGRFAAEIRGLEAAPDGDRSGRTSNVSEDLSGQFKPEIGDTSPDAPIFRLRQTIDVAGLSAGTLLRARMRIKTKNLAFETPSGDCLPFLLVTDDGGCHGYGEKGGGFAGTCDYAPAEILYQLGESDATLSFELRISSAITSGVIDLAEAVVEVVEALGAVRTDLPECRLARDGGGTPRLQIDGRTVAPLIFFGNTNAGVVYEEVAKAAAAGFDIFQTCMDLPWAGTAASVIELAARANPRALFIPRLYLNPPRRWREAHPDQMVQDETGSPMACNPWPSLGSDLFFEDCKRQLELFIRYLHNSPCKDRLIGIMPDYMAEGAWFYYGAPDHYFDYSEVNRRKFGQWLAVQYGGDIAQLNAAWGSRWAAFADVRIPPSSEWEAGDDGLFRDPAVHRAPADYLRYHNAIVAERIVEVSDCIKKLTDNKTLVLVFYGYHNETVINCERHGNGLSGQLGTRRVLESPSVDILAAPCSYHGRAAGGPAPMMSVVDSAALNGKMYLQEDDARTWLWKDPPQPDYWMLTTEWDTLQCLGRNFGNLIAHNQATWWMDLCANGSFNAESIWENNRKLAATYRDSIARELPTRPQVALLYDEESFFWLKSDCYDLTLNNICRQRDVFQSLGAPVCYYYIQDLAKIPDSVRLFVFVNTFHLGAAEEARIESIKRDGRTLLWLYAPGYVGETGLSKARVERLTGFALDKLHEPMAPTIRLEETSHAIARWIGAHAFGPADPIAPLFRGVAAADPEAVVLGRYEADGRPGLLLKELDGWTSVFCGSPALSGPVLRGICRHAGVDLLVDPDRPGAEDVIAWNGRYLYCYARGRAGRRQFRSPMGRVIVSDALSGDALILERDVTEWSVDFQRNEQKVFLLQPADAPASGQV